MPISGVVLTCHPQQLDAVVREVSSRPGAEVRAVEDGHLVVVTDTDSLRADHDEVQALESLPGVAAAHVVFCNVEDLAETPPAEASKP
jgi:nitrate reductase NapAB chaperone NapD